MKTVWLSTLHNLTRIPLKEPIDLKTQFPTLTTLYDEKDKIINIEDTHEASINMVCDNIQYPCCKTCQLPLCGKQAICKCPNQFNYQQEFLGLHNEIEATKNDILKLENTPFRQSRNAFGFSSGVMSGVGLILGHVACSVAITWLLLIAPPLLAGMFVYRRGKQEEEKINAELKAEWLDKKISLLCKHREAVQLRYEKNLSLPLTAVTRAKPPKEKRGRLGNPLSHFIVPMLSMVGATYSIIKYGLLSAGIICGGPITWGIAIGLGICIGLYFAYQRHQYLSRKIQVENKIAVLTARENDINSLKGGLGDLQSSPTLFKIGLKNFEIPSAITASTQLVA